MLYSLYIQIGPVWDPSPARRVLCIVRSAAWLHFLRCHSGRPPRPAAGGPGPGPPPLDWAARLHCLADLLQVLPIPSVRFCFRLLQVSAFRPSPSGFPVRFSPFRFCCRSAHSFEVLQALARFEVFRLACCRFYLLQVLRSSSAVVTSPGVLSRLVHVLRWFTFCRPSRFCIACSACNGTACACTICGVFTFSGSACFHVFGPFPAALQRFRLAWYICTCGASRRSATRFCAFSPYLLHRVNLFCIF